MYDPFVKTFSPQYLYQYKQRCHAKKQPITFWHNTGFENLSAYSAGQCYFCPYMHSAGRWEPAPLRPLPHRQTAEVANQCL